MRLMPSFHTIALALLMTTAGLNTAHAALETFDTPASAAADGFILGQDIRYIDAGRPYLNDPSLSHSITYDAGSFTFNSMDFNLYPASGYHAADNDLIRLILLDVIGRELLNVQLTLPYDGSWLSYSNDVPGVHQIVIPAIVQTYWPSFDNLVYEKASVPPKPIPVSEPEPSAILLSGLFALACFMKCNSKAKA